MHKRTSTNKGRKVGRGKPTGDSKTKDSIHVAATVLGLSLWINIGNRKRRREYQLRIDPGPKKLKKNQKVLCNRILPVLYVIVPCAIRCTCTKQQTRPNLTRSSHNPDCAGGNYQGGFEASKSQNLFLDYNYHFCSSQPDTDLFYAAPVEMLPFEQDTQSYNHILKLVALSGMVCLSSHPYHCF